MCVDNGRRDTSLADKSLTDLVQLRASLLKILNAITSWLVCIPHAVTSNCLQRAVHVSTLLLCWYRQKVKLYEFRCNNQPELRLQNIRTS
jgi:hypothetical protein